MTATLIEVRRNLSADVGQSIDRISIERVSDDSRVTIGLGHLVETVAVLVIVIAAIGRGMASTDIHADVPRSLRPASVIGVVESRACDGDCDRTTSRKDIDSRIVRRGRLKGNHPDVVLNGGRVRIDAILAGVWIVIRTIEGTDLMGGQSGGRDDHHVIDELHIHIVPEGIALRAPVSEDE